MIDPNSGYRIITYKLINKPSAEKSGSAKARIAWRERLHHAQEEKGRPSIGEFQRLREKLRTDGERIQREIEEYTELSQMVMQLTKTISESVEKVRASGGSTAH